MKLSKEQRATREGAINTATDAHAALVAAIATYNEAVRAAWSTLEAARDEYNASMETVGESLRAIGDELAAEIAERSDHWRESDAGSNAETWAEAFAGFDPEVFEPDEPDEVDEPDAVAETIAETLTTESES